MQRYYSQATGTTYLTSIHADIPSDAVPISEERFLEVIANPPDGKVRAHDDEGLPILITSPPQPPVVPAQVTRAQGKAALITAGIWDSVLAYVDSITDETEKALALVALNDTTHWQRSSPFLASATVALGLSEAQVDDLFIQASQIQL